MPEGFVPAIVSSFQNHFSKVYHKNSFREKKKNRKEKKKLLLVKLGSSLGPPRGPVIG
jgi:hypothetical protein